MDTRNVNKHDIKGDKHSRGDANKSIRSSENKISINKNQSKLIGNHNQDKIDKSSLIRKKRLFVQRSEDRNPTNLLFDFEDLNENLRRKLDSDGQEGNPSIDAVKTSSTDGVRTKKSASRKTAKDNHDKNLAKPGNNCCNGGLVKSHVAKNNNNNRTAGGVVDDDDDDDDDCNGDERLKLSSWGLPEQVLRSYEESGVRKLFQWQAECLCTGRVLERGNLVYSAPTSAGKTMVAELLLLKSVLETKTKALFILPFVSVAREKCLCLQKTFQEAGVTVGGFYGGSSPPGGISSVDVAVCTIEKANNLVNRLLEEEALDQLGCVVVDELHMVGDPHRGYLLELLVTKILYATSLLETRRSPADLRPQHPPSSTSSSAPASSSIQIVGMSATLPNLNLLASWLNADLFTSDYRPVPLSEVVKVGAEVFDRRGTRIRVLEPSRFKNDEDHVIHLCLETVAKDRCSVLVFCPTKNWCEKLADSVAREFFEIIIRSQSGNHAENSADDFKLELSEKDLSDVLELLRRSPSGLDPSIGKMIRCGVAYHHAGLTFEERDIIEGAFRTGTLKVLVATSTLSSGVNLPARRVIVRTPIFHGACIDALVYKQMIGRAGRKGVDVKGEGILICKTSERKQGFDLLNSQLPPIKSCLHIDPKRGLSSSMKRAILEVIVSRVASKMSEVELYVRCTMLSASMRLEERGEENPPDAIASCIDYLLENEFIQIIKDPLSGQDNYAASQLGRAVVSSGLSPEEGLKVFVELQKSCRCFVLENDLHLVYLVTPVYMLDQFSIDWYNYLCLWESLTPGLRRVGEVVGVQDRFISKAVGGRFVTTGDRSVERMLSIHRRFYLSLALFDLINEHSLTSTCLKFKVNKGALQGLQQSSSTFAGMVTSFVGKLGWHSLEVLLNHFQSRLSFGVQQELVDLIRIPVITARLARCFYAAGYVNVASLALSSVEAVVKLLRGASPFLSKKKAEGESEWELEERTRTSRCHFVSGAGRGLTEREAAQEIVSEARRMVGEDLAKMGFNGVVPLGAGGGDDDNGDDPVEPPSSKKAKLSIENQTSMKFDKAKEKQNPPTDHSQTSKNGKPRPSVNNSQSKANTSKANESCLANTSVLIPPKSFLELQRSQKSHEDSRNLGHDATTDPKPAGLLSHVEFFGLNSERRSDCMDSSVDRPSSKDSLTGDGTVPAKEKDVCNSRSVENKTLTEVSNDTRMSFRDILSNNPGSAHPCTSSTPKTEKNLLNSFFPSSPKLANPPDSERHPDQCTDMEVDNSVELIFGNDSNNFDDSRFSDNTQFLLMASEQPEDLPNIEKDKHKGVRLLIGGERGEVNADKSGIPREKRSEEKLICDSVAQFHEEILAGSQLMEEFMQNTFDADGKYGAGGVASTPKTKPPSVTTPRDVDTAQREKIKRGLSKDDSYKELVTDRKLYCQVIPMPGRSRNKEVKDSEKKKQMKSNKSTKEEHGAKKAINNIRGDSDLQERKQNCSLLFDGRAPYSEEMFDDDDDDLVFEVPGIKPEGQTEKSKDVPSADNVTSFAKESEQKRTNPANQMNSFTKLKTIDSKAVPKIPPVENHGKSKASSGPELIPAFPTSNNEPSFEANELFNSFFDQSGDLEMLESEKPGLKASKTIQMVETNNSTYTNDLITPTAAAQLLDSMIFDEKDLPSPTLKPRITGTTSTRQFQNQTPTRQGTGRAAPPKVNADGGFRTPNSSAKKFKSFDDAFTSQFDPDVEFVMRVFCDENKEGDGTKTKTWNKKAPKRHNSSNNFPSVVIDPKQPVLATIPQSPFDGVKVEAKKGVTPIGQGPDIGRSTSANVLQASNSSKLIPKSAAQTSTHHSIASNNTNTAGMDNKIGRDLNCINDSDLDDIILPTPPGSPERSLSKALCSGTATPRRLLVGVVKPSPRASGKDDPSETPGKAEQKKRAGSRKANSSRRLDMDVCDEDKAPPMDFHPPSSNVPVSSQETFTICDVASNRLLFETFLKEWRTKSYFSICLACDRSTPQYDLPTCKSIGGKFRQKLPPESSLIHGSTSKQSHRADSFRLLDSDLRVTGLAVSWNALDVYYVSLRTSLDGCDLDRSMAAPDLDPSLGVEERLEGVKQILEAKTTSNNESIRIVCYDAKTQFKVLSGSCGLLPGGVVLDPKVACWLLDPGSREKTLHGLVATCCSHLLYLLEDIESTTGICSLGMTVSEVTSSRLRSCLESVLVRQVMGGLETQMRMRPLGNDPGCQGNDDKLWKTFVDVEMPVVVLLAKMELNGMGFDDKECESQKSLILRRISNLETSAYELAGHPFSLTSPDDVSRVLFVELGLPPSGEPGVAPKTKSRANSKTKLPRFSSNKEVLEKLVELHPIAGVILEWRKLTTVVSKMVFPLQRAKTLCQAGLEMNRIHGVTETHTATGRVTMREPNLQNVPKDFSVAEKHPVENGAPDDLINESMNYDFMCSVDDDDDGTALVDSPFCVSMRSAFVPFKDGIMLAADYSQLELRIIAHMSDDRRLVDLLNRGGDVFRAIAGQLAAVAEHRVTPEQRQRAKQICYGMIYGIGAKSLGRQLNVDEEEAARFIESFKSTYSGIRSFLNNTIEGCRRTGFVETMFGRRRKLQSVNSDRIHIKAHAERQSVNTTIQGTAADIVKSAMLRIDERLVQVYPQCRYPHRHLKANSKPGSSAGSASTRRGAYLVLQLHDELIYEVNRADLQEVARIVKCSMEQAVKLNVVLPVKIKIGPSWGKMADYEVPER